MESVNTALLEKLRIAAKGGFPVYLLEGLTPCIVPARGPFPNKVVVHSIPKAGTYFVGKLLAAAGYVDTEIHFLDDGFSDYRGKTKQQKVEQYLEYSVRVDLGDAAKLILDGQFVLGHLPCTESTRGAFTGFKQLFVYRNARDCLCSSMRFVAKRNNPAHAAWTSIEDGRERFAKYLKHSAFPNFFRITEPMLDWFKEPNTLAVCFERLYGDQGEQAQYEEIKKVFDYLEISSLVRVDKDFIGRFLGAETMTWSGKRTETSDYWSPEAESLFLELGGAEINRALGYAESAISGETSADGIPHAVESNPLYRKFLQVSGLGLPESLNELEAAAALHPKSAATAQNLREALKPVIKEALEAEKYEAALLLLDRFPQELSHDAEWHFFFAECLHRQKTDFERALRQYNLALDFGYYEPGVRLSRGILYYQMGRTREACADIESALPFFKHEMTESVYHILKSIYLDQSRELTEKGELSAAVEILDKGLLLLPDDGDMVTDKASLLMQIDSAAAHRELVKMTVIEPNNADAHLKLALNLYEMGRDRNAEAPLQRVLALDPFNEKAVKLLNNLYDRHQNRNDGSKPDSSHPSHQGGGGPHAVRNPKVSIVTPAFNCARYIRSCIESVLAQDYPNFEHIIVDGASKDGTVEILKEYPHLKWISEPDRGECEALNKALRMSTGDIIGWMNADDSYEKRILPGVVEEMTTFGGADLVYGKTVFVDENNTPTQWVMPTVPINLITLTRWYNLNLFQPSIFFSRRLFETVGFFREDLQYGIDYEYWFRIASKGFRFRYIDQVLSRAMIYRSDGKTGAPYAVKAREWLEICYSYQRYLTYGERLHFWKDFFIFRIKNAHTFYKGVPLTVPNRIEAFIGLLMAEKEVIGMDSEHFHQRIAANSMGDKSDALGMLGEILRSAGNKAEAAKAFEWALNLNASEVLKGAS